MAPEVVSALIGGVSGLITGAVGSLFAPWVNWGVEKRRLRRQERSDQVAEWRAGVDALRKTEDEVSPIIPFPGGPGRPPSQLVVSTGHGDPLSADVGWMGWFLSLRPHLSSPARAQVDRLRNQRIAERGHGTLPGLLMDEINRIAKGWGLV